MQKKSLILLSLFISSMFSPYLIAKEDKYKNWLKEEVAPLISKEERKEFKKFKNNKEKDKFINLFWAKRDPTPLTRKNEFKDGYYKRLNYVNKVFASHKGWRSDMGKVIIVFGTPKDRKEYPETWIYDPIPQWNILEEFKIVFLITYDKLKNKYFSINRDASLKEAVEILQNYPKKTLLYPNLKDIPKYIEKFILDSDSLEGKVIERISSDGEEHFDIPLKLDCYFTKAQGGNSSGTYLYRIEAKDIELKKLTIFGRFKQENQDFEDFKKILKPKKFEEDFFVLMSRTLMPGKYLLYAGILDKNSNKYSILKKEIHVPNFWDGELNLSSIILTDRVEEIISETIEEAPAFHFGKNKAIPKNKISKESDNLSIFYQIYNPKTDNNKVSLVEMISLKSENKTYRIAPRPYDTDIKENQALISGLSIPLSSVVPGKYKIIVRIIDKLSNKSCEKEAEIEIVE